MECGIQMDPVMNVPKVDPVRVVLAPDLGQYMAISRDVTAYGATPEEAERHLQDAILNIRNRVKPKQKVVYGKRYKYLDLG
jgi:hypothetical protein